MRVLKSTFQNFFGASVGCIALGVVLLFASCKKAEDVAIEGEAGETKAVAEAGNIASSSSAAETAEMSRKKWLDMGIASSPPDSWSMFRGTHSLTGVSGATLPRLPDSLSRPSISW